MDFMMMILTMLKKKRKANVKLETSAQCVRGDAFNCLH